MDQKESNSIFRGSASDLSRQNQDGRSQQPPPPPPQQPPQKCPRCDSLNTKFCYYNNYSLTQPRYFCKTCRRYWTQGGTLRNVPVGGGCRKGSKRAKTSTAAASSSTSASSGGGGGEVAPPVASMSGGSPYFPAGGGFLSSLAAIQSLSQNLAGGGGDAGFLQGFGMLPPFASQIQAQQLFQMGGGVDDGINKSLSLDNSPSILHHHQHHPMTGPPATSSTAVPRNNDWMSQGMILSNPSSTAITTPVDHSAAGLWGIGAGATAAAASNPAGDGDNSARDGSSSSSRWPNIPGYGRQL